MEEGNEAINGMTLEELRTLCQEQQARLLEMDRTINVLRGVWKKEETRADRYRGLLEAMQTLIGNLTMKEA